MNTNSLLQHVNERTRRNNILDLVMTTTGRKKLEVTDKLGDNQMIDFTLEIQDLNTPSQHKQVPNYKRSNFKRMKEKLGSNNYKGLKQQKRR
ncbi:hypothetical protein FHG87_012748 [Trinorchestia longiramus]|nr:hypothetical protein FHG87_012748 [Trinorchestia longiramus]